MAGLQSRALVSVLLLAFLSSAYAQTFCFPGYPGKMDFPGFDNQRFICDASINRATYNGNITMAAESVIDTDIWDVTVNGWLSGVIGSTVQVRYESKVAYGSIAVTTGAFCPFEWRAEQMQVLTLKLNFKEPLPDNSQPGGILVTRLYSATMCSSGFASATWHDNSKADSPKCVTDIKVDHRRLNGDYIFPFEVDALAITGTCPSKGLSVVVIAVIIVCCIIVLLAVVGVFVYLRYRKRYAQGSFNKQFEKQNKATMDTRKGSTFQPIS
jgi:hypothetical protein